MLQISLNKILSFFPLIVLLFFVFAFSYRSDQAFDQDLGRHLKLGEIISQTYQVPKINLFSYTWTDFKFVNSHYLFEVVIYQLQKLAGLDILLVLKIVVISISALIVLLTVADWKMSLALPISFIFFHLYRERLELRPEIFSFLFTTVSLFILTKIRKSQTRSIFILPVIQLIWINTHIYFAVGLVLQMVFLLTFLIARQNQKAKSLCLVLISSFILSLINPNFFNGLLFPLQVSGNYGYSIVENQSVFTLEKIGFHESNFLFYKLSALIVIAGLIVAVIRKSLKLENLLLSVLGLSIATLNVRGFPYLVLVALPATIVNFGSFKSQTILRVLNLATLILLIYESIFYLSGSYYKLTDSDTNPFLEFNEHSQSALNFVVSHHLPQPIYNNFDIGSYIIYRGYPNYKVFVDGRPEAYPASFFQKTYIPSQMDQNIFKQTQEKYHFQTIIFSISDQTEWGRDFLRQIVQNRDWQTVYLDDFIVVLVKTDPARQLNIKPVNLAGLNPNDYNFSSHIPYLRMSLFLLNTDQATASTRFAQKALEVFPQSPLGNSLMAFFIGQIPGYENQLQSNQYLQNSAKLVWW